MLWGMKRVATKSPATASRRRRHRVTSPVRREKAVVTLAYNAVLERDGDWWIGWIKEAPGVTCQEKTRAALLKTLRITLAEILELREAMTLEASDQAFLKASVRQLVRNHLRNDPW